MFAGHSVDPYNGKCLRSSAGSIVGLPVIAEPDTAGVLAALRAASVQVLATTVDGEMTLDEAESLLSRPTAWLFGPESHGLPAEVAARADHRIRIPMPGDAESLNAFLEARHRHGALGLEPEPLVAGKLKSAAERLGDVPGVERERRDEERLQRGHVREIGVGWG